MHMPIAKRALSVREAAEASSLSKSQIHNLIRDGRLRAGRIGKRVIIPSQALDDLLESAAGMKVS
ncbi:MAG: helix-turn-helix domain-containing protein [Sphingomonadales bacterium]|nr:helix-turn-helix domain-containing protein [Sphingomonadales bacterium]